MAEKRTYEVLRQHDGDRQYFEGDERELMASDAKHLVDLGVLREKVDAAPENKKAPEPQNKAAGKPAAKKAD